MVESPGWRRRWASARVRPVPYRPLCLPRPTEPRLWVAPCSAEVLAGSDERMTFSSGDPRALALYIRAGMRPWWPLLYMEVEASRLGGDDAGIEIVPSDVTETAERSLAWTGVDRSTDFAHYGSLPEAAGFVVRDGGAVAAVGWARRERLASDGRWLDHASLAPDADPVRAALAILRAAAAGGRTDRAHPRAASGHPGAAGTGRPHPGSGHVLCHEPRPPRPGADPAESGLRLAPDTQRRRPGGTRAAADRFRRTGALLRGDRHRLLDRHADQAAVLGPRAVVVADPLVPEQLVQHEPAVRRPLADAAVGDDVLVRRDALALVERSPARRRP